MFLVRNRYFRCGLMVCFLCLPTFSQNNFGQIYEITPTLGWVGSSPMLGVQGVMSYPALDLQLSAAQVTGNVANLYPLLFGINLPMGNFNGTTPYGFFSGGLALTVPFNSVGAESVSSAQVNFGGGFKYTLSRFLGLRFEVSQMITQVENKETSQNELLFFQSISLGLIFKIKG